MSIEKVKLYSKLLMIFSFVSIIIALFIVAYSSEDNATSFEELFYGLKKIWVFFLFLPISVGSMLFGIHFRKRYKVMGNIVCGAIVTILLFGFGIMHFLGLDYYSTDYEYVTQIQLRLNTQLPDDGKIVKMDWTIGEQTSYDEVYYISESVVRFTNSVSLDQFEINILSNDMWVNSQSAILKEIVPIAFTLPSENYTYFLLFSETLNEYNLITKNDEEQSFIYLAYDPTENILLVYEFSLIY